MTDRIAELESQVHQYGNENLQLKEELKALQLKYAELLTKCAENEKESNRYRHIIERDLPDLICQYSPDGTILLINDAYCQYFNKRREELIGKSFLPLIPESDREYFLKHIKSLSPKRHIATEEHRVILADGPIRCQRCSYRAFFDEQGRAVEFQSVGYDITDQMLADEAKKRYQMLFENSRDMILLIRQDGLILDANRAAVQAYGYTLDELRKMTMSELTFGDFASKVIPQMVENESFGIVYESVHRCKDGSTLPVEIGARVVSIQNERIVLKIIRDISERKAAEQALRESEKQYRELVQNANSIIVRMDAQGNIIFLNEFGQKYYGYREEEILGRNVVGTMVPQIESSGRNLGALIRDIIHHPEQNATIENEAILRDGRRTWVAWRNTPIFDNKGNVKEILGVGIDVTQRKQMEEVVQENLRFLQTLIDTIPGLIYYKDTRGVYSVCNATFVRFMGVKKEDIIGHTIFDILPRQQAEKFYQIDRQLIQSKGQMVYETSMRHADGTDHDMIVYKAAYLFPDGQVAGLVGIAVDITARKKIEDALQKSEALYRLLADNVLDVIWTMDMNDKITYITPSVKNLTGFTPEEAKEWAFENILTPDSLELVKKETADLKWTGAMRRDFKPLELELYRKDGSTVWTDTRFSLLYDENHQPVNWLGITRDISERKRAENELDEFREKMMRAEQLASLGIAGATLAHQINQPLTIMLLSLQKARGLLMQDHCPNLAMELLDDSIREISTTGQILNDFLKFARNAPRDQIEKVNLASVVRRIVRVLFEQARRVNVELVVENMDDLPEIAGNQREIEQVFFILIQNGIQAADPKKTCRVTICGAVTADRTIEVKVSDTGRGIAPEHLGKIFDPFFTTKPVGIGTGLGLCVLQRIVLKYQGRVRVDSTPAKGTVFTVSLPVRS